MYIHILVALVFVACSTRSDDPVGQQNTGDDRTTDDRGNTDDRGATDDGGDTDDGGATGVRDNADDEPAADPTTPVASPTNNPPKDEPSATASRRCYGGCEDDVARPEPKPGPVCPGDAPSEGDPCDENGSLCGYGDASSPRCRDYFECVGMWQIPDTILGYAGCAQPPADYCPADPRQGEPCVVSEVGSDVPCVYDGVDCFCLGGVLQEPGVPGNWACYGPPEDTRCPAQLPPVGSGCETSGVECHYAPNGCVAHPYSTVFCFDGAWEPGSRLPCLGG